MSETYPVQIDLKPHCGCDVEIEVEYEYEGGHPVSIARAICTKCEALADVRITNLDTNVSQMLCAYI